MYRQSVSPPRASEWAAAGSTSLAAFAPLETVEECRRFTFPAHKVWGVLGCWDISTWMRDVPCELLGKRAGQPGAERMIQVPQGTLHERLVRSEEVEQGGAAAAGKRWQLKTVALSAPFSMSHFEALVQVTDHPETNDCEGLWRMSFTFRSHASPDLRAEASGFLKGFLIRLLDEAHLHLVGKPKACAVETRADGRLVAKDDYDFGLPRHAKRKGRPNTARGLPMAWDFTKGFPIKRVKQQLAAGFRDWQADFVDFCLARGALRFGDFLLPDGRKCPYFFNPDLFASGAVFCEIGRYFARCLAESRVEYDMLFGPEVGLGYAAATAVCLGRDFGVSTRFAFQTTDRRGIHAKPDVAGSPVKGRVVLVADVIQEVGPLRDCLKFLLSLGAVPAAVVVALDCQERSASSANTKISCLRELQASFGCPVFSLVRAEQIAEYVQHKPGHEQNSRRLKQYLLRYCAVEEFRMMDATGSPPGSP